MAVNLAESNLQAISNTIAILEKEENPDEKKLKELRKERDIILRDLNLCIWLSCFISYRRYFSIFYLCIWLSCFIGYLDGIFLFFVLLESILLNYFTTSLFSCQIVILSTYF